jgi:hypothetical protein
MKITVKDLVEKIKTATYLKDHKRKKWLKLIPKMSKEQLIGLGSLILWTEKQNQKFEIDKNETLAKMHDGFTQINKEALKTGEKTYRNFRKYKEKKADIKKQEKLLEELE